MKPFPRFRRLLKYPAACLQQRRRMFPGTRGNSGSTRVLILKGGNPFEHQEAFRRAALATRSASHLLSTTSVPLRRPMPRNASRTPHRPVGRTVRDHGTSSSAANSVYSGARHDSVSNRAGRSFVRDGPLYLARFFYAGARILRANRRFRVVPARIRASIRTIL